MYQFCFAIKFS